MESKRDRLLNAFDNMNEAIEELLTNRNITYNPLDKLSKTDYKKVVSYLHEFRKIIYDLVLTNPYKAEKLDEIRRINLSIRDLYEEGDYDLFFSEIFKANNKLCEKLKEVDRQKLGDFKRIYRSLPTSVQDRLNTATRIGKNSVKYFDKKTNNYQFIIEHFLSVKYNFKKIKFEVISPNGLDDKTKRETIIRTLESIKELCNSKEYSGISAMADNMIEKYSKLDKKKHNKFKTFEKDELAEELYMDEILDEEPKGFKM